MKFTIKFGTIHSSKEMAAQSQECGWKSRKMFRSKSGSKQVFNLHWIGIVKKTDERYQGDPHGNENECHMHPRFQAFLFTLGVTSALHY